MQDFVRYLPSELPAFNDALDELIPKASVNPSRLHEAMRYSVFAGGKRIRPALTLVTGEWLGAQRAPLLVGGAALEMIHTYSLVHDDLPALDNDDLRRGRPTLHRHFDEAMAILAGDSLLTLGLTTLARLPREVSPKQRQQAVEMVGQSIGSLGMIGGQVADLEAEDQWPDDAASVLEFIHRRKTGDLLTACVRLAGIYAGSSTDEDQLLTELGDDIGLMFQIADDILDVEGSSGSLGKTAGKDAAARKLTYPALFGLEESKARLLQARDRALDLSQRLAGEGGENLLPSLIQYLTTRDH